MRRPATHFCAGFFFINNFTKSEFEAGANKFDKGVGEVEGTEIEGGVDFKSRGGGEKGLFGEEDEEREQELGIEVLFGEAEECEKGKNESDGDGGNVFVCGVRDTVGANTGIFVTLDDVVYLCGTGEKLVNVTFEMIPDVREEWGGVGERVFARIGELRGPSF